MAAYHRIIPYGFLGVSIIALLLALISQYGFGLMPCELCLYQRMPYVLVIAAMLLTIIRQKYYRPLMLFAVLCFLIGTVIAFYHMGVEYKWFKGFTACTNTFSAGSIEELRKQIIKAPVVRCDEPQFIFLGFSMAGWNMLFSLFLTFFAIYSLRYEPKR